MMEAVLFWQILVGVSILIARLFSSNTMFIVAVCWTLFTFAVVWTSGLMLLQLVTAWGTVWLLTSMFGKLSGPEKKLPDVSRLNKPPLEVEQFPQIILASNIPSSSASHSMTSIAVRAEAPLEKISGLIENVAGNLETHNRRQEANTGFFYQLALMNQSVLSAMEIYESEQSLSKKLSDDPQLEKVFNEVSILFEKVDASGAKEVGKRIVLRGLNTLPLYKGSFPEQATEDRIRRLKASKLVLNRAYKRVIGDGENIARTDEILSEPFLPFLEMQMNLVNNHLKLLAPPKIKHETSTAAQSTKGLKKDPDAVKQSIEIGKQVHTSVKSSEEHTPLITSAQLSGKSKRTADEIESYVRILGVPHLTHFTRCENLLSILHGGLMSVEGCTKLGLAPMRNDIARFDRQLDGTSLSVAFPNYRMFWKYRQLVPEADWVVLLISRKVLWEKDCGFYCHNAADARMIRQQRGLMKSAHALQEMFGEGVGERETWLRSYDPTDPQAEVLVYETIEPTMIEAIAFETADVRAKHLPYLLGFESFYAGLGKGLFASRRQTRTI